MDFWKLLNESEYWCFVFGPAWEENKGNAGDALFGRTKINLRLIVGCEVRLRNSFKQYLKTKK